MKTDVYVEGSLRAGSIHDDARDVMSDGAGNPYSYDTNAPYFGFHLGVGFSEENRIICFKKML